MNKLLIPLFALVLAGAGCDLGTPTDGGIQAPPTSEDGRIDDSPSDAQTLQPAETDETWNTYTNDSLDFAFDWPTRGRYAPEWRVEFIPNKDGFDRACYGPMGLERPYSDGIFVEVDSRAFCHTETVETSVHKDAYMTAFGETLVVIHFQKTVPETSFDVEEYKKTLDGIVGTFRQTE